MLLKAVSVYDSKAQVYFTPFFVNAVGAAIRSFGDEANKSDGPIGKHPGDYQLYEIGSYDDTTGTLKACVPMRLLGTALEFVTVKSDFKPLMEVASNGQEKA